MSVFFKPPRASSSRCRCGSVSRDIGVAKWFVSGLWSVLYRGSLIGEARLMLPDVFPKTNIDALISVDRWPGRIGRRRFDTSEGVKDPD